MSRFQVRRVAVLGAGVMGAQIAAHLVNVKVPVTLFDLPSKEGSKNGIVTKAIDGLKKLKPSPLGVAADAALTEVMKTPEAQQYFTGLGMRPTTGTPAEAAEHIRKEEQKREEHRRNWQRYGELEIKRASWKRRPDGSWEVEAQRIKEFAPDVVLRKSERVAVDCRSLKVNRLAEPALWVLPGRPAVWGVPPAPRPPKRWEGWKHPAAGDPLEQLLVDRC
ncbi:MAG: 3-hydroxyacyl-CoA dehydrogenase NAD-binding domain-containing protein, partial [Burkholderiaceae bacterium]